MSQEGNHLSTIYHQFSTLILISKISSHNKLKKLVNLNAELMYEFCNDVLIPELVEQDRKELEDDTLSVEEILKITEFVLHAYLIQLTRSLRT